METPKIHKMTAVGATTFRVTGVRNNIDIETIINIGSTKILCMTLVKLSW